MPHWINQPWQRNLSKSASGKPGAVDPAQRLNGRCKTESENQGLAKRARLNQRFPKLNQGLHNLTYYGQSYKKYLENNTKRHKNNGSNISCLPRAG
jgi:hypothetical protein